MTKNEYESLVQLLDGEKIQQVEYFEIRYDDYETDFYSRSNFDSLDYGLNRKMRSGQVFGLIWGSEFTQYGVSVLQNSLQSEVSECREIDVTSPPKWSPLCNAKIAETEVDWSWVKVVGLFKKKIDYPQRITLIFENGAVLVVSAFEIREDTHFGMADNITVFFNRESALKYRALNA